MSHHHRSQTVPQECIAQCHERCVGQAPETGADLMSQPTLSRLESLADWRALARIGLGQIDLTLKGMGRVHQQAAIDGVGTSRSWNIRPR